MEAYLACLIRACDELGFDYEFFDKEKNFLQVNLNGKSLHFQINRTPFVSAVMAGICKDKEHSYLMFKDSINMPKTIGFLDYTVEEKFLKYLTYDSANAIIERIEEEFTYPLVIKKNKGSFGINVFLCHNKDEVKEAIVTIFNKNSNQYDYIALAQEYIPHHREFRVVCFRGEVVLAYERISGNSDFNARYWEAGKGSAKHITDPEMIEKFTNFVRPALGISGLEYVGFDIVMRKDGSFSLLELNSGPKYDHFIKDNGTEAVVELYKKILARVLNDPK